MSQIAALVIFALVFAIAEIRKVHVGVLALSAAALVGVLLANMELSDVLKGVPVNLIILLAGVTLLFGIAQLNGTIDTIIDRVLARYGHVRPIIPTMFFVLAAAVAAMAATAALAVIPVGMQVARRYRIDPMLMSVSIGTGLTVGMFAPIGLFGIITYGTAVDAGIDLNPITLFVVALVINVILLVVGHVIYGGLFRKGGLMASGQEVSENDEESGLPTEVRKFERIHYVTIAAIIAFVATVISLEIIGFKTDIGLAAFLFASILLLVDPGIGKSAVKNIDWSTILLVCGIITFVSVLQAMGAVDLFATAAMGLGAPILAAVLLFVVGGLVSAFASTTGTLAAVVPLAVPLAMSGDLSAWVVVCGLALCSALADVAPFSTMGATMAATAPEWPRGRIHSRLLTWGLSMVVVGPLMFVALLLIVPS
ncbi:SLC13 family permease [Enemella sp. A6]